MEELSFAEYLRYAALFSFIWKFRKLKDGDLHGKVRRLVDKSGFAIRTGVVQTTGCSHLRTSNGSPQAECHQIPNKRNHKTPIPDKYRN